MILLGLVIVAIADRRGPDRHVMARLEQVLNTEIAARIARGPPGRAKARPGGRNLTCDWCPTSADRPLRPRFGPFWRSNAGRFD
jgi:hypothetical protein